MHFAQRLAAPALCLLLGLVALRGELLRAPFEHARGREQRGARFEAQVRDLRAQGKEVPAYSDEEFYDNLHGR